MLSVLQFLESWRAWVAADTVVQILQTLLILWLIRRSLTGSATSSQPEDFDFRGRPKATRVLQARVIRYGKGKPRPYNEGTECEGDS